MSSWDAIDERIDGGTVAGAEDVLCCRNRPTAGRYAGTTYSRLTTERKSVPTGTPTMKKPTIISSQL